MIELEYHYARGAQDHFTFGDSLEGVIEHIFVLTVKVITAHGYATKSAREKTQAESEGCHAQASLCCFPPTVSQAELAVS